VQEGLWRGQDTSEVHCEQQHAVMKLPLIYPAIWQEHLRVNTAGLPAASLVAETVLVEVETQALMVWAALVVHAFRLWMRPMLEALTTAVHQALMLDRLELGAAK